MGTPDIPTADAPPTLESFDAPVEFDGTPVPIALDVANGNPLSDVMGRFTLAGERVYAVTPNGVGAADLATGEILWETPFPAAPAGSSSVFYRDSDAGAPVVSDDGSTVYAVAAVTLEGSGTSVDSDVFELVAVATDSGEIAWSVDVPTPADLPSVGSLPVEVVSASAERVLIAQSGDGYMDKGAIAAVDPSTQTVLWNREGVLHGATDDTIVAVLEPEGSSYPQLVGLDAASGAQLWSGGTDYASAVLSATVVQTAAGLVVTRQSYGSYKWSASVLDPRSGQVVQDLPGLVLDSPTLDGEYLYDFGATVRSLDPSSLAIRWSLPTEERVAPRDPIAFGGLVYGSVGSEGVVLDGDAGTDVAAGIPGRLIAVNEHGALAVQDHVVVFLPATA